MLTKGGFEVVAVRGGSLCCRSAIHCASADIAIATLDVVVWRRGGGSGDDSYGDVIALAATKVGSGQRDESGRGRRRRQ